jgi:hypothetical protein
MTTPEFKSKRGGLLRDCFDFVFGLQNKKGDILDHWVAIHDSLSYSPQEFYETIEKELEARKVPGMEISREVFAEGGMLSERRIYLRLLRERLMIYTCASPFGVGYFFSCRTVYVPALVRLWHILAAFFFFSVIGGLLMSLLGVSYGVFATITLIFALAGVMRNISNSMFADLDALLLKIPIVSTFYQDWFRADTYYRTDTRFVYVERIPQLIWELAQELTAVKGVRLVRYRFAPVLNELYRQVPDQIEKVETE